MQAAEWKRSGNLSIAGYELPIAERKKGGRVFIYERQSRKIPV